MVQALGLETAPLIAGGRGKLESALASPRWAALHSQADLCEQAALLVVRIAQAHAFLDTNKRVAYITATTFLRMNGRPLPAERTLNFAQHLEAALEHRETVADVAQWLRDVTAAT